MIEWHDVNKELPEENSRVLIKFNKYHPISGGYAEKITCGAFYNNQFEFDYDWVKDQNTEFYYWVGDKVYLNDEENNWELDDFEVTNWAYINEPEDKE